MGISNRLKSEKKRVLGLRTPMPWRIQHCHCTLLSDYFYATKGEFLYHFISCTNQLSLDKAGGRTLTESLTGMLLCEVLKQNQNLNIWTWVSETLPFLFLSVTSQIFGLIVCPFKLQNTTPLKNSNAGFDSRHNGRSRKEKVFTVSNPQDECVVM